MTDAVLAVGLPDVGHRFFVMPYQPEHDISSACHIFQTERSTLYINKTGRDTLWTKRGTSQN